ESVCSARSHAAGSIIRRTDSYIAKAIAVEITDTRDGRAKEIAIRFTSQDRIGIRSLDIAAKWSVEDIGFAGAGSEKLVRSDNDVRNTVSVNVLTAGYRSAEAVVDIFAKNNRVSLSSDERAANWSEEDIGATCTRTIERETGGTYDKIVDAIPIQIARRRNRRTQ